MPLREPSGAPHPSPVSRPTLSPLAWQEGSCAMTSDPSAPFGELLRRARQAAGLTQEELAERAGLSRRGIADLESGARKTPRKDTVALLAAALGVSEAERIRFEVAARGGAERQMATQSASKSE